MPAAAAVRAGAVPNCGDTSTAGGDALRRYGPLAGDVHDARVDAKLIFPKVNTFSLGDS